MSRVSIRPLLGLVAAGALGGPAAAGTFIPDDDSTASAIMHVRGYPTSPNPVGGNYVVTVCLNPNTTPVNAEQSVRNAVAEFNRLQGINGNVTAGPNGSQPDFESMLMHELGHCMGLDHNTYGPSETGNSAQYFFTNAQRGANAALDTAAGVDGVRASRDDVRGDDVNRHWFRAGSNDPFAALPAVIDQTTWSVSPGSLPGGHNFAEAATSFNPCAPGNAANTSLLRGVNGSMAVMMPVLCSNNAVRKLHRDDVATFRIARAGYNGTQGNADDYTWTMNYVGRTTNCNIPISLVADNQTGFAQCNVSFFNAQSGDNVLTGNTTVIARASINWFYNQADTTGGADVVFRNGFE